MVYKVNQTIIMKLRFLTLEAGIKVKAQIQKQGRLGFSRQAIDRFGLSENKGLIFAVDENQEDNSVFYGLVTPSTAPGAIRFNKVGLGYFAIDSPTTFNKLGYDYQNESCIFAVEEVAYDGANVLKFTRREARGNKTKSK